MNKMVRIATGVAALVVVFGACGGSGSSSPAQRPDTTTTVKATTTTTLPPSSASTPTSCHPDVLLPPVKAAMDRSDEPDQGRSALRIVGIDVLDCRNGYARVSASADTAGLEAEQVFLHLVSGHWEYLEGGTGVDCHDMAGLTTRVQAACVALGLTR